MVYPDAMPYPADESLVSRRPGWLQKYISADFTAAADIDPFWEYSNNGIHDNYLFRFPMFIVGRMGLLSSSKDCHETDKLLDELHGRGTTPPRILDIGTGAGAVVRHCLKKGFEAQGLSAYDYRKDPRYAMQPALTDKQYILGDAHDLASLPGIQPSYDLVMSQYCVGGVAGKGLRDPLVVIEQMANLVSTGGILAVEACALTGRFGESESHGVSGQQIIEALYAGGFEPYDSLEAKMLESADLEDDPGWLPPLLLNRCREQPINFAVDYERLPAGSGKWPGYSYTQATAGR